MTFSGPAANGKTTPGFLSRVGVRGKLFLAFYGISALAVLAAGAALYSFTAIDDALEVITQWQIPLAVKSQELSRHSERVVAAAPRLLTVASSAEKETWSRRIAGDIGAVSALLAELRDLLGAGVQGLENDVQQLRSNLAELDRLVDDRLTLANEKRELLNKSIKLAGELQGLLTPWVSVMDERIAQWRRTAAEPSVSEDLRNAKDQEFEEALAWFRAVQESEVLASSVSDQLQRAASADDSTAASVSGFRLVQSLNKLESLSGSLDPKLRSLILENISKLLPYVAGQNSIPVLRERELNSIAAAATLLAENAARSDRLTATVDRLVRNATRGTTEANARALSVVRFSTWAVVGAVVASLLSSALIMWLYVDRQLVSRLRELSQSMLAIAGGRLTAPLPARGGLDEIARMVDALAVFRDTAIEVEQLNLRERQVVLDTINYGVLILDPEFRVRMYNRAFRELAELPDAYLQAKPNVSEIIESSQRRGIIGVPDAMRNEYLATRLAEVRAADQPPREWHWPDGRVLQYEVVALPDGGRMLTYFDLTQLKRTEEELRAAKEEAERASRTKSAFLASMSHELRTPLNAIIGFTRLIMRRTKDLLPQKQYENLEKILTSGEHLLALINSILDLSKIEAGRMEVRPSEFRLGPLIDLGLNTTEPLVRSERVRLVTRGETSDLVMFTDQDKLKQILLNLLSNAAKFTEQGEIIVRTEVEGDKVQISVADTGPGIPATDLNVIFEEFRQLDTGSSRTHKGTGLGLAISRQLASLLDGELTVDSNVGVGSTFTLTVPLRLSGEHANSERPSQVDQGGPIGSAETAGSEPASAVVLVIDDDPDVIYLLTENLAEVGYRVVGAQSGEEGLRKARELNPFAIILDVMLPEADGWQVLHALKSDDRTRDVPVIVLSVVDQQALGYRLGASDFLLKPFDRQMLLAALARVSPQCGRVLVVDDDPNVPELVRQWLDQTGCEIDWAPDGSVALSRLAERRPSVILLDLLMPRMDGLSFLEALNADAQYRDIPVIVLTAKILDETERATLQERVHGLIEKRGLDRASLIREVRRALPAAA